MHRPTLKAALAIAILVLTSCGVTPPSETGKKAEARKPPIPPGPITGRTAFWEMYRSAHAWSPDVVPLALEDKELPGYKTADGKAAMWKATFGSPKLHQFRVFSYSIADLKPDVVPGVMIGNTQPWSGPVNDALPFETSDFNIDSDAAYQKALAQAAPWTRKNPGKDVSFTLGNSSRFNGPVWYVLWGEKKAGYSVYVDARTGAIVKGK